MSRTPAKPVRPSGAVVRWKQEGGLVDGFPSLRPWQRVYGDWLTGYSGEPNRSVRLKQAAVAAGYQVKGRELERLEGREDFRAYCARALASDVAAARTLAEAEAYRTIEQWGVMRDAAYAAGDYKAFVKYADPILDRVWPKASEGGGGGGQVVVQLGVGSFAARAVRTDGGVVETTEVVVLGQPES